MGAGEKGPRDIYRKANISPIALAADAADAARSNRRSSECTILHLPDRKLGGQAQWPRQDAHARKPQRRGLKHMTNASKLGNSKRKPRPYGNQSTATHKPWRYADEASPT